MKSKIKVPCTQGLDILCEFLSGRYLAEVTGVHRNFIAQGRTHSKLNGVPFYCSEEHVRKINEAIPRMVEMLESIDLTPENMFDVMREHMGKINMPTLFVDHMGRGRRFMTIRLNETSHEKYYGRFTEKDCADAMLAIRSYAAKIESLELVCDRP